MEINEERERITLGTAFSEYNLPKMGGNHGLDPFFWVAIHPTNREDETISFILVIKLLL